MLKSNKDSATPKLTLEELNKIRRIHDVLALIPENLTGADLGVFYEWAFTDDIRRAIRTLENRWMPDPNNLGDTYNGPVGENGEPTWSNVVKWKNADQARMDALAENAIEIVEEVPLLKPRRRRVKR